MQQSLEKSLAELLGLTGQQSAELSAAQLLAMVQAYAATAGLVPTIFVAASDASANSRLLAAPEYRCDGVADDVQIQAAIGALPAGGGKVVLSEGSFDITATIVPCNGLTLLGAGLDGTRLVSSVNSLTFFEANNGTNAPLERACLSDFTMDGDNHTEQCAIDFRYALGCTFPRLRVIDMPDQPVAGLIGAVNLREYTTSPEAGSSRNHFGTLFLENVERGFLLRGFNIANSCEENVVDALYVDNVTVWGVSLNYTANTRIGYCGVRLGANSAVGFYFNKDNIVTGSVLGNSVGHLFVDSTDYTSCVGVNFGYSRQNAIGMLAHLPAAFNGTLVEPHLSESYRIVAAQPDGAALTAMAHFELKADGLIADPGDAGAIPVTMSGHVALVTGGAGETRILQSPDVAGLTLDLYLQTHGGGNCVVTSLRDIDQAGNNVMTFNAEGQHIRLAGIEDGAAREWRVVARDGVVLS